MKKLILLLTIALNNFAFATTDSASKPNILIIVADDLGWADVGYNNKNVYSPNIDKLASDSAILKNHYSMSQCTPTRVALFTGKYPSRSSISAQQATSAKCFEIGSNNLALMAKSQGYKTYMAGKWHMGAKFEDGPMKHGFDSFYGSTEGAVGMYRHQYRNGKRTWNRDHKFIEGDEDGVHTTDLLTKEAERVFNEDRDGKPFFFMLTYYSVHTPLDERGEFVDRPTQLDPKNPQRWLDEDKIVWFNDPEGKIQKEKSPAKRLFLSAVNHFDDSIGKVIQALKDANQLDNTVIFFTSDNGPQVNWMGNAYPDDLKLKNFNQPDDFRGAKTDVYEGGIRVPGFVYWKNKIESKNVEDCVHVVDWFSTIGNIINHDTSAYNLDGIDIGDVLFESDKSLPDRLFYWLWGVNSNRWALQYGDWKIVYYGTEPKIENWKLYNLKEDPKESKDLSKTNKDKLEELYKLFEQERLKDSKVVYK